jgi:GNAT superfamily N-acetyltransferase
MMAVVTPIIRLAGLDVHQPILVIAARAWQGVFSAVNDILGPELALRLHGEDWRAHHAGELRELLASETVVTWVAELDGQVVGFASARVADPQRRIGEVAIVGVDPPAQRSGVGATLTRHAEAWLQQQGVAVVFIGTGGHDGHAPARRLYEALGYRPFPVVQYLKVLHGSAQATSEVGS